MNGIVHGIRNSRCKCRRCLDANAEYMREYRARTGEARRKDRWWNNTRAAAVERLVREYPERFEEILAEVRAATPSEW